MSSSKPVGRFRYLLMATSIATYLLIVMGGVVRVTGSGLGCPDWPTCFGQWIPPMRTDALLEYFHRLLAILASPLILISAGVAWRRYKEIKWITRPLYWAVGLLAVQGILGGVVVLMETPPDLVAVHLGLALIIMGLVSSSTVMAYVQNFDSAQQDRLKFQSPFARLSIWGLILIFVILVSGAVVSSTGSTYACSGWPLCNGELIPSHPLGWINIIHRLAVGLGGIFMLVLFLRAWRTQRTQRAILTAATTTVVLYFAQGFVGALKTTREFPIHMLGLHEATAAAVMAAAVVMVMFVGLAARTSEEEEFESAIKVDKRERAKDMLSLTKPIIVLLLLVTTYAGMVVGSKEFPTLGLTFWTMVGGAFAAGGSGAVNQYIDRETDQKMTRTAKRPLASGRMTAAEGLAFGVGLLFIAFYLMAGFVNMLAALLSLSGMIYYVLLYSIYLKKTTVQNIVIGGGAGAIPPMVGVAATTGQIDLTAFFLFAIVFMWTPPHFWALALVRTKDYARAGIPMLPVVKGEVETRRQIWIYTLELVALTLLMAFLKLAGTFYLVSAIILGIWLIFTAWKVFKQGGNSLAWKMYRYSSMYLLFLFGALMLDAVY